MWPVLGTFGGHAVHTWGALVAVGFLVTAGVGLARCSRAGIPVDRAADAFLAGALAGVIGARGLYVLSNLDRFDYALQWLDLRSGGASFFGALVLAVPVASLVAALRGVPVLRTWDAFAPGFAVGFAIARVGCFAAGCCHGAPTSLPWGVSFPALPSSVHPTQLLEVVFQLGLAAFLLTRRFRDGAAFAAWLGATAAGRFFLELLRGDPGRDGVTGLLTGPQELALVALLGAVVVGLRVARKPLGGAPPGARAKHPDV